MKSNVPDPLARRKSNFLSLIPTLISLVVTGGLLAAQAAEPLITHFDPTGRLTFQEAPGAASYRVEWTTNLTYRSWSSNAPGLAAIHVTGAGTLTVTVGVVHAACFYRVAAVDTNPPSAGVASTFDAGNENWLVVDYPFRSHIPNPSTKSLSFDPAFGNPAGSVRVGDVYAETGIAAPAAYLGNVASYYGGVLTYDIYLRYSDGVPYPAVVLNGGTKSLYYDAPSPPVGKWDRRTVPLTEEGWIDTTTSLPATQSEFKAVLTNLVGLYIYTEWHSGTDDTSVDNVVMSPP